MSPEDMLDRLVEAQRRNSCLAGSDLVDAAEALARIARGSRGLLVAHDSTGDRIIGAALALQPGVCRTADMTARVTGQRLILVSGVIAAPHAIVQTISRLKSLGAAEVHVAVLGGWPGEIGEAASTAIIGAAAPLTASAA